MWREDLNMSKSNVSTLSGGNARLASKVSRLKDEANGIQVEVDELKVFPIRV